MIRPFDIVSWDVDGTLYEMPQVKRAVIAAGLRGLCSLRIVQNSRELSMLGQFRKRMAAVRAAGGVLGEGDIPPHRDHIITVEERWYGAAMGKVGQRAGVGELIDAVDRAGLRQIVVSDYRAEYKLAVLGLEGRFQELYAGEQLGHLKPSAELFRLVVEREGVEPERILHIGDGEATDGVAARAVGCQVAILGAEFATAGDLHRSLDKAHLLAAAS